MYTHHECIITHITPFTSPFISINTGNHVVLQLLQQKQNVRAIVRSKERLINLLDDMKPDSSRDLNMISRLDVTEASLLDLSQDELEKVRL